MTTGLEYKRTGRQREALRVVSRSVYQEPHALLAFEVGNFPIIRLVNLHLMSASIRLWSYFFRSWMVDFNSSR